MGYLKQGCCGCTLRKSTLVIGYFWVVMSIVSIITNAAQLANLSSDENRSLSRESDSLSGVLDDENPQRLLGNIIAEFISTVVAILLVVGSTKENRWLILPWIIITAIGVAGLAIGIVILLILLITVSTTGSPEGKNAAVLIIIVIVVLLLVLALIGYLWWIVISYFVELRTRSTQGNDSIVQMRLATNTKDFEAAHNAVP